jgi:hypothetical protein
LGTGKPVARVVAIKAAKSTVAQTFYPTPMTRNRAAAAPFTLHAPEI